MASPTQNCLSCSLVPRIAPSSWSSCWSFWKRAALSTCIWVSLRMSLSCIQYIMLWVTVGKVSLIGSRISPNLYCSVRYSNTEQHSRTHCGTTDAEIDENFSFRSDGSNWLTIQLRSRKDAESQSEDSGQDDRSYVVMCQVDEYIEEVEEDLKRTIKLEGSREYCNSGIVEYTINRGAKAPSIFEKQTQEEPERQHSSTQQRQPAYNTQSPEELSQSGEINMSMMYHDQQKGAKELRQFIATPSSPKQTQQPPEQSIHSSHSSVPSAQPKNTSHNPSEQNFSKQEKAHFTSFRRKIKEPSSTDEQGMKFVGNIQNMLRAEPEAPESPRAFMNASMDQENFKFNPSEIKKIEIPQVENKRTGGFQESLQTNTIYTQQKPPVILKTKILSSSSAIKDEKLQKLKQIGQQIINYERKNVNPCSEVEDFNSKVLKNNTEDELNQIQKAQKLDFSKRKLNEDLSQEQQIILKKDFGKARKGIFFHNRKKQIRKNIQYKERYNTEIDESQDGNEDQSSAAVQFNGQDLKVKSYLNSGFLNSIELETESIRKQKVMNSNGLNPYHQAKYTISCLSCSAQHLQNKNFDNRMSLELIKDNQKIYETNRSKTRQPPYEWSENISIPAFDELKLNLIYNQPKVQSNSAKQQETKRVLIGTACLSSEIAKNREKIVLPLKFHGLKMGQIKFTLVYHEGKQTKPSLFESNSSRKNLQDLNPRDVAHLSITAKQQQQILSGLRKLSHNQPHFEASSFFSSHSPSKASQMRLDPIKPKESEPPSCPVNILYPRSRMGFITGMSHINTNGAQIQSRQSEKQNKSTESPSDNESARHQHLHLFTIIFKNYGHQNTGALSLCIQFGQEKVETESVYGKDVLWTKQTIKGDFKKSDQILKFSLFEKIGEGKVLFGKNSIFVREIRPKHKMYSFKFPIFSTLNTIAGQLMLHFEFKKKNQKSDSKRQRFLSYSVENKMESKLQEVMKREKSFFDNYHSKKYLKPISSSSDHKIKRKIRQPFYYAGKNVKFGHAARFRHQSSEDSWRSIPGPGSYCLPSVFDRHLAIQ